jgi:HD-like signal output (HDOD) protein
VIHVQCTGCQKKYSIPDEKIPKGKILDLPCPACKTIIKLKREEDAVKPPPANERCDTPPNPELLMKIVKESKALPPMPQIIAKATEVLSSDKAGFKEVGEVLATDQAMATRVLKLANSAYYGRTVPVSSVQQASALLGFQTLLELITVVSTSKMMGKRLEGYDIEADNVWRHSLLVATGAKLLAQKKSPELVNDAFNAGLIHDSGMLILDPYVDRLKETYKEILGEGYAIQRAERQLFGFDHGEIASEFFKRWKLPEAQLHAIYHHHDPEKSGGDLLSYILHIADHMANLENTERNFVFDSNALNVLGLSHEDIDPMVESIREDVNNIMASMS